MQANAITNKNQARAGASHKQCIRVLILLHGVVSEILSCCMYVFGIVSTVFFSFFLLSLCFLHNVANKGIYTYIIKTRAVSISNTPTN